MGLELLEDILNNVNRFEDIANVFYPKYHIKILTEVLDVMTDGFHKSGLESQSKIFYLLIHVLTQNFVNFYLYRLKQVYRQINNQQTHNFYITF